MPKKKAVKVPIKMYMGDFFWRTKLGETRKSEIIDWFNSLDVRTQNIVQDLRIDAYEQASFDMVKQVS